MPVYVKEIFPSLPNSFVFCKWPYLDFIVFPLNAKTSPGILQPLWALNLRIVGGQITDHCGLQGAHVLQKPSPSLAQGHCLSRVLFFLMAPGSAFALVYNMGREHEDKKVLAWLLTPPKQNLQWPALRRKKLSGDVRFMSTIHTSCCGTGKYFSYPFKGNERFFCGHGNPHSIRCA